jgi:hypothetical protein
MMKDKHGGKWAHHVSVDDMTNIESPLAVKMHIREYLFTIAAR